MAAACHSGASVREYILANQPAMSEEVSPPCNLTPKGLLHSRRISACRVLG